MALRVKVCKLSDVVDNQIRAFKVRGVTWPVLVTRIDNELIATPGVCPHDDVSLADGDLEGHDLRCPGHGYVFDLTTGACRHQPQLILRRYKITVVGPDLYVDLI